VCVCLCPVTPTLGQRCAFARSRVRVVARLSACARAPAHNARTRSRAHAQTLNAHAQTRTCIHSFHSVRLQIPPHMHTHTHTHTRTPTHAQATVAGQLDALRQRDVARVFGFASPQNRAATGPVERFGEILESPMYMVQEYTGRYSRERGRAGCSDTRAGGGGGVRVLWCWFAPCLVLCAVR
jgi:hypothetical protein